MTVQSRQNDLALIDTYVQGKGLEKPVIFSEDELDREEAVSVADSQFGEAPPPPGVTDADVEQEQRLSQERLKEAKRQAREDEKASRGMRALQREQAREVEQQRKQQEKEEKEQAEGIAGVVGAVKDAASGPVDMVKNAGTDTAHVLEKVSTPGSILLPVLIIIVLYLAIVPVNGYPRLAWLWFTIIGNASLTGGTAGGAMEPPPPMPINTQAPIGAREDQSTIAHRQLVNYHSYTGVEELD